MTTLTRAADHIVADIDAYVRAAKAKPDTETTTKADATAGADDSVPLPSVGETDVEVPEDPDEIKELIMSEVREQLDWDGAAGDPNASKDALEDALADMFDADVEIVWDGESTLILRVEGEQPIPLTMDSLGDLLEALAKGDGGDVQAPADQAAGRGYQPARVRGKKPFDESKINRDPGGEGGGRFVKKGVSAAGATAAAAKTAAKAGGDSGRSQALAARAKGRSGPRATAKAVGDALSAGTGKRVKVSGNKDGSFNVGTGAAKKKMSAKKAAALTLAVWFAGAFAAAALGAVIGPAAVLVGGAVDVAAVVRLIQIYRSRDSR